MKMQINARKMAQKSHRMKPLTLSMGVCDETEYKIANINFTLHVVRAQRDVLFARSASGALLERLPQHTKSGWYQYGFTR
jgi:hypothetical protein